MRPSGKTNLIALVVIAAVLYGIWWIVTFSTVYMDNWNVIDAVKGAYNDSGRKSDQGVLDAIIYSPSVNTCGFHDEDDGYGNIKKGIVGLGLKPENVTITRDDVRKTIRIVVEYERTLIQKPTDKVWRHKFRVVKEGLVPVMGP